MVLSTVGTLGSLLDMNDKVVGVVTQKAGRIDDKFMKVSEKLANAYRGVVINEPLLTGESRIISPHPEKILADLISIIRDYTIVGIGYAYSIDYAKDALSNIEL
jgi:hypothetical protein